MSWLRDVMCWWGLHWPVRWETRPGDDHEELLCQREDCRYRLLRRARGGELDLAAAPGSSKAP